MKTVGVVKNPYADMTFVEKIIGRLKERGIRVIHEINESVAFVLVLGGDGAILRAAKPAALLKKPVYGINLGRVGYLSDVDKTRCLEGLENVLNGAFHIDKRIMIESRGNIALNEICVTRANFGGVVSLSLYINGEFTAAFRADGVLVCTPTGSTAYNLSAGGPVIKPDAEIFAVTPICPQTSHIKSIVLSSRDVIKIQAEQTNNLVCSFDGGDSFPMDNLFLEIKRSRYYTSIIRTGAKGVFKL